MHGKKKFVRVAGGAVKRVRGRYTAERIRRAARARSRPWQTRDQKPWYKAPRAFRNELERRFRAGVRELIHREDYDRLPARRHNDADWLWG